MEMQKLQPKTVSLKPLSGLRRTVTDEKGAFVTREAFCSAVSSRVMQILKELYFVLVQVKENQVCIHLVLNSKKVETGSQCYGRHEDKVSWRGNGDSPKELTPKSFFLQ